MMQAFSLRLLQSKTAAAMLLLSLAAASTLAAAKPQPQNVAAATAIQEAVRPTLEFNRVQSLKQLGVLQPIHLRGNVAAVSVPFGVRLDELAQSARLQLHFTPSPALLTDLSHLRVYLNEELIGTVLFNKEQLGSAQQRVIDFDPRLLSDYNQLRFELVGHYTRECEDPAHTSIWVDIDNVSAVQLATQRLALANDLALLPAPFFDQRDNRDLKLPFVFAHKPSQKTLRTAGVAASWFGAMADYRSVHFPYAIGALPRQHALLFALNGDVVEGIDLPEVKAPTIALRERKDDPSVKMLVIQGRNEDDLAQAVNALVLGQVVMAGPSATVTGVDLGAPRKPYDAPRWVRTDRPVRFGEIVKSLNELQVRGYTPGPIRVNVRLPADLMTTFSRGVPINLKYRYTPPLDRDDSTLNININEQYVQTFRLDPSGAIGQRDRVVLPLIDTQMWNSAAEVTLPAFQVGSNNQLQFNFNFDINKTGWCRAVLNDNMRAAIDPDSTIDLSSFPHYLAMPNLAAFANSGYPFTKFADLAQTTVVMGEDAQSGDIEAMLEMLGLMGRWSGWPALRYELTSIAQLPKNADADLLLIGSALQQSDKLGWEKNLPALIEKNRRKFQAGDIALDSAVTREKTQKTQANERAGVAVESGGHLGAFISFESPLASKRTVVAVTGSTPQALRHSLDALSDSGRVSHIRGDIAFVRAGNLSSYQIADNYYVGSLSWWRIIWYHLSQHPVLLALFGIIVGILGAVFLYNVLRQRAERRLNGQV